MRHALWLKFIAVLLCAAGLLAAVGGGFALAVLASENFLGNRTYEQYLAEQTEHALSYQALMLAENWATREYGKMPEDASEMLRKIDNHFWLKEDGYAYEILDEDGKSLYSSGELPETEQELEFSYERLSYEEFLTLGRDEAALKEAGTYHQRRFDNTHGGVSYTARNATLETPITLKLYLAPNAVEPDESTALLGLLSEHLQLVYCALIGGILLFAVCAVYLCAAAGCRKDTTEIKAGGLNALPLDLYAGGILLLAVCAWELAEDVAIDWSFLAQMQLAVFLGCGACLCFVGFCFAAAAQLKMKNAHWFWNSVTGRCIKLGLWLLKKGWALCRAVVPKLWRKGRQLVITLWGFCVGIILAVWGLVRRFFVEALPWLWKQGKRLCKDLWKFVAALAVTIWGLVRRLFSAGI